MDSSIGSRIEGQMKNAVKAVETTGSIDQNGVLHLDEPLKEVSPGRVKAILLFGEVDDVEELEWLRTAAASPAFDVLRDSAEDVYAATDGKPFSDEG